MQIINNINTINVDKNIAKNSTSLKTLITFEKLSKSLKFVGIVGIDNRK